MRLNRIRFLPEGISIFVDESTSVLSAARDAGIEIASVCGGEGTCEKCLVRVLSGRARMTDRAAALSERLRSEGYTLACQTFPIDDLVVEVPIESRVTFAEEAIKHIELEVPEHEVGLNVYPPSPMAIKVHLKMHPPSLTDNVSDLKRLLNAVKRVLNDKREFSQVRFGAERPISVSIDALRQLPTAIRAGGWEVTATLVKCCDHWEVIRITPGKDEKHVYGAAIDVGTTTVTVHIVDLETFETVQRLAKYNEQFVFGEDVISRIAHVSRNANGLNELREAALRTINSLLRHAANSLNISHDDIACATVAGNTVMTHLLLGIDPTNIRIEPYIPAVTAFPPIRASDVEIAIHKDGYVFTFPCVASYVGGDIVAGTLVSGMVLRDELSLLIDMGTNGEMVLGNRDFMVTCACSIGPAFEGSGIKCGMRSVRGAISGVKIDPTELDVSIQTIGDAKPIGICGSGLVELLAELKRAGIIDMAGNFVEHPSNGKLRQNDDGDIEFVLVRSQDAGIGRDITITQADIKNLIRSKAAVYAALRSMLNSIGLRIDEIKRIFVAGAFGSHLNVRRAIEIGLLPDLPEEKFVVLGNSSVKGARLALLSQAAFDEAHRIASKMTYIELSVDPGYMGEFISANFIPHTDLQQFPSVKHKRGD
ncbi:MAG: ASKHA domain-containing protein [Armatimonadota bacterium]|nr:ASKHA domain-containing protein [Armatimonadota bacterium]MCX7777093.1 ASKHA domain-containing protein [Armatimonadota bacterium]MDW8025140.1 ASKHA domain-containing protein [Armatimonadota bacterium]